MAEWKGDYAKAKRDRFGGICINHKDGSTAYIQPGDDANSLSEALDACKNVKHMTAAENIDGLLCDHLE